MAKNKTNQTESNVSDFINSYVGDEQKKKDSFQLLELMSGWAGFEAKMWGPAIIGFGSYHYQYDSGHEGDMPLIGFSPRKAAISLYVYAPSGENDPLLTDFGKFKMGKSCLYVKKLSDINLAVLEKMCRATIAHLNEHHQCACREK